MTKKVKSQDIFFFLKSDTSYNDNNTYHNYNDKCNSQMHPSSVCKHRKTMQKQCSGMEKLVMCEQPLGNFYTINHPLHPMFLPLLDLLTCQMLSSLISGLLPWIQSCTIYNCLKIIDSFELLPALLQSFKCLKSPNRPETFQS